MVHIGTIKVNVQGIETKFSVLVRGMEIKFRRVYRNNTHCEFLLTTPELFSIVDEDWYGEVFHQVSYYWEQSTPKMVAGK